MKTLYFNLTADVQCLSRRLALVFILLFLSLGALWAQVYNPNNGTTHYPNGTRYFCNCVNGYGPEPVVIGPDGVTVGCVTNAKLCRKVLEDAADDAEGGGNQGGSEGNDSGGSGSNDSGGSTEGGNESTQSYSPELNASNKEYKQKLKIRKGVWAKQDGTWIYADSPHTWTQQIIESWSKRKKK